VATPSVSGLPSMAQVFTVEQIAGVVAHLQTITGPRDVKQTP
jgi:hypothetical protein